MNKNISLYIHIPFCEKKCYYCDFSSYVGVENKKINNYVNSLIKEISLYKEDLDHYTIKSIFFGGGTPSYIDSKYIVEILDFLNLNFNIAEDIEITLESNPNSITKDKLEDYKSAGVNRISLGLQSTDNEMLKFIGRVHTYEEFIRSYNLIKSIGIENINVDLIFGIPGQTVASVEKDIDEILKLDVNHISFYSLILEGNTPMEKWVDDGRYDMPNEIEDRKMYHNTIRKLSENNYNHYEISNFSKDSKECYHNIVYWKINPYIGLGLSSHSNFKEERFFNTSNLNEYIEMLSEDKKPIVGRDKISLEDEISEYCIMGIRLIEGIDEEEFSSRFNNSIDYYYRDILEKHVSTGLLYRNNNRIYLSEKGLDLANLVEVDFLL